MVNLEIDQDDDSPGVDLLSSPTSTYEGSDESGPGDEYSLAQQATGCWSSSSEENCDEIAQNTLPSISENPPLEREAVITLTTKPSTRRSTRAFTGTRRRLVESPITDSEKSTHDRDREFVPSEPSPVKPIHRGRSKPKTKQETFNKPQIRYSSPERNIAEKESLSRSDKDEVARLAPHGHRCVITHLEGLEVEFCHLLKRTTPPDLIRRVEWFIGLSPGTLFVNSRWNIISFIKTIHTYFDHAGFILIPNDPLVFSALRDLLQHNREAVSSDQRRRYDEPTELSKYTAAEEKDLTDQPRPSQPQPGPSKLEARPSPNKPQPNNAQHHSKPTTFRYKVYALCNNIPSSRRWSRLVLDGSRESGYKETKSYIDYHYPFTHPDLQQIESHVHPVFALAHARQNLDLLPYKERYDLLNSQPEILRLSILTEGWFSKSTIVPADFLGARIRDPGLPQDVVTTSPRRASTKSKGKGKAESQDAEKNSASGRIAPHREIDPELNNYYWKVRAPTDALAHEVLEDLREQLRVTNPRITVEAFDPTKPLGYTMTRSKTRASWSESQQSSIPYQQPAPIGSNQIPSLPRSRVNAASVAIAEARNDTIGSVSAGPLRSGSISPRKRARTTDKDND
ncbi:hypothetical protein D9757_009552 [Collybiopsis confluens]|uniref:Uncharacterized protein n=1 Tax=Collybiopsis confluens TaxID=2823264 RepID=A0A8H5M2A5_9AGAR|nr:hypothetical protein D9757_009552 [Collybiopsis confluens]